MPSNVQQVFAATGIRSDGCVSWGAPVPETDPGVYVIALTVDTESLEVARRDPTTCQPRFFPLVISQQDATGSAYSVS